MPDAPVRLGGKQRTVPVDQLEANPWNPNVQTPLHAARHRSSIREFGFVDPITVRGGRESGAMFKKLQILGGEHSWEAAKELGLLEVPVFDVGRMSDARAKMLGELLNMRGDSDPAKWAQMAASVRAQEPGLLDLLPIAKSDIEERLRRFGAWGNPAPANAAPAAGAPARGSQPPPARLFKKFSVSLTESSMERTRDLMRRVKAERGVESDVAAFEAILDLATSALHKPAEKETVRPRRVRSTAGRP
jgi:hypothetical protein